MKKKIMNRRRFIGLCEYIILNFVLILSAVVVKNDIRAVTWISLVQIIVLIIFINRLKSDCVIIGTVFMVLTYLFHFGQALIFIFFKNDIYSERNVISMTSQQSFVEAELFAMACIFMIGCGYIVSISTLRNTAKRIKTDKYIQSENNRIKKIAIIVFAVTIIPMLYIDIQKVLSLSMLGYEATYEVYTTGIGIIANLIGQFCKPILGVLLYCYSSDKKKANLIFGISSVYLMIMMLSGDRGTNMIYFISLVLVYFLYVKRFRLRTMIVCLVCGYLLLTFISAISLFRYTDFSIAAMMDAINRRSSDGIIYSTLREFGGSMVSLVYSMEYIPLFTGYNFGMTYLGAIFTITPWLPGFLADFLSNSFTFTRAFPLIKQQSLGGSFLGELYFNFGWLSPILTLVIGNFIGKLDSKIRKLYEPRRIAVIIVLLPSLFLWVRDFVSIMVFRTFWLGILFTYVKVGENRE